jgi:flagellar hook assembly protein FlgD
VAVDGRPQIPAAFELDAPTPNPFSREVSLSYGLPRSGPVEIAVFDLSGRRVRVLQQGARPAGRYHLAWDGRNEVGVRLGSGIYFVRMDAAGQLCSRKIVLAR